METLGSPMVIGVASVLVGIGGFVVLWLQLRKLNASARSATQAAVFEHSNVPRRMLLQYPELRRYFYENVAIEADVDDATKHRVQVISEVFANYFEHIVLQRDCLRDGDWQSWVRWIQHMYAQSPTLKAMIHWDADYSYALKHLLGLKPE